MVVRNAQVVYANVPDGEKNRVGPNDLQVNEATIDLDAPLKEGEFIIKQLALSMDPYIRARMRDPAIKTAIPAYDLGKPIVGDCMSVCVKSNNSDYKEGDIVNAGFGGGVFEEYTLVTKDLEANYVKRNEAKETGLPIGHYLGVLGMPGMTAYVGMMTIAKPKAGETMYVSTASGAVGLLAAQMGKVLGLRVVGSAGSDEKVDYLLKEIGLDGAFNYKKCDIDATLSELCPNGIDIYFDNVGGKTLDVVLNHANRHGRIVACGMISQYNAKPDGLYNMENIVMKSLTIKAYLVYDYPELEEPFRKDVTQWLLDGKIKYRESVADGIDKVSQALNDLLSGNNIGKQIVKVASL
ncbi:hypothetical protein BDB00DRAFT_949036 [Zychaea mexicana]|uniref:uncharacterized protein n=1 Tax=Zychaea mexicana TaxID=64656 RepID=UPI0022FF3248|nr:uncharacterized protein BDB00DRAFT_949036 [Zychaea mexicana]KAI9499257.1 hypothetical protein BDB00DRAFT_949036 [Zychaea mexicana]